MGKTYILQILFEMGFSVVITLWVIVTILAWSVLQDIINIFRDGPGGGLRSTIGRVGRWVVMLATTHRKTAVKRL